MLVVTKELLAMTATSLYDRFGASLYRYDLPPETFETLDDAGMWISRAAVTPFGMKALFDLPAALAADDVDLRPLPSLAPLRDVWSTTLHVSGIRLRNAKDWPGA